MSWNGLNNNPMSVETMGISAYARIVYTFVAAGAADDDKISSASYYNRDGTLLGVLTYTYVGSTNNISSIERTS